MLRRVLAGWLAAALLTAPLFAAQIPRKAPDIEIQFPGGSKSNLSKYKGKVIALEFLLTTCPHCKRTSAVMTKLSKEYTAAGKNFQALGVAINDGAEKLIPAYNLELDLDYPVGYANRDRVTDFLQHPIMLTMWMPQLVFIDKNGMIVAQYPGTDQFFKNEEANMRKMIDKLLTE